MQKNPQYLVYGHVDGELQTPRTQFEGTRVEVYAWLKDMAELDAPGFSVLDRYTSVILEEGDFVREFEEELRRIGVMKQPLSEDRVRTLALEEFSKVLDELSVKVEVAESNQTKGLADALMEIIGTMAGTLATRAVQEHEREEHGDTEYDYGSYVDAGGQG